MSKTFLITTLIAFLNAFTIQAQSNEQDAQQAVVKLFEALSARDAVALRNQCTVGVRFLEYGEAWPLDTLVNLAITKNIAPDFKRTNKFDFISTKIQGDVAWLTYHLYSDFSSNGKDTSVHWLESVVLLRDKKKWKIDLLHSTRMK